MHKTLSARYVEYEVTVYTHHGPTIYHGDYLKIKEIRERAIGLGLAVSGMHECH